MLLGAAAVLPGAAAVLPGAASVLSGAAAVLPEVTVILLGVAAVLPEAASVLPSCRRAPGRAERAAVPQCQLWCRCYSRKHPGNNPDHEAAPPKQDPPVGHV